MNRIVFELMNNTRAAVAPALVAILRERRDDPEAATISGAFQQTLHAFEAVERTLRQNEQRVENHLDVLHESALRHETAVEVVATVEALLLRVRQPRPPA
jgi:hypothetical protein